MGMFFTDESNFDKVEVLARFLNVSEDEISFWSDESMIVDRIEYELFEEEREGFQEYLGFHEGYHIYINNTNAG